MLNSVIHWGMKMSVTRELLDALKASNGGLSDYRIAKLIGVAQPTVIKYNKNQLSLSAEKVILVCKLLDLDPSDWVLRLYLERAKCTDEIDVLNDLRSRAAA